MRVARHWNGFPREVYRCPIIGHLQGQAGWGFKQPDVMKDVPAHGRSVGPDDL